MLGESIPDSEVSNEHIDSMISTIDRAANINNTLLVYSGQETLNMRQVDFHTFIEDSADEWREQLRDTTNLSVMFLDRLPDCDIDAEKLKTALWQILKNAEDAGPDGAELSISVRLADTGRLETPAPPAPDSEGFVEVMIADRGSGMSEEVARHAFEPFFCEKNFAEKNQALD